MTDQLAPPRYLARCPVDSPHRLAFLEMFGRLDRIPLRSAVLHRWHVDGYGGVMCYELDIFALEPEILERLIRFYGKQGMNEDTVRDDLLHWGMAPVRQLDLIVEKVPVIPQSKEVEHGHL